MAYSGAEVLTNQYSVTDHTRELYGNWMQRQRPPGVFFFYDVSPIMITHTEFTTVRPCDLNLPCPALPAPAAN